MHPKNTTPYNTEKDFICDICNQTFVQSDKTAKTRRKGKISNGKDVCPICVHKEASKRLVSAGYDALKKIDPEIRRQICSDAGKKAASSPNSGRFTKEKWVGVQEEDRQAHGKRASDALHKKLRENPELAAEHYKKIHAQKGIGYVSVAHAEIHEFISSMGFETHGVISQMEVDELHEQLKIVVEYNGDYWHCNPRIWKADDFNKSIKMFAKDKWEKDYVRYVTLRKMGYTVIVIWESGWIKNPEKYINRIKEVYYDKISEKDKDC